MAPSQAGDFHVSNFNYPESNIKEKCYIKQKCRIFDDLRRQSLVKFYEEKVTRPTQVVPAAKTLFGAEKDSFG